MATRRRFSRAGFLVGLGIMVTAGCAFLLLQYAAVALGERKVLDGANALAFGVLFLGIGLWQGYRKSHGFGLAAVRFRKRVRRRQWGELFGFAVGLSLFGVLLGLVCSIPKWMPPAAENAAQVTLVHVLMAAAAGFVGGFGVQFTPVRRLASR